MGSTGYTSNMKSLSLIVLFMSLLEPTTRHEQLRDDWNLAWLLLEKGMPMIVRVPDQGVLRLRVRSRGAVRVSVRAAGDLVTQRRLVPGTDPGAGFPGQQPSPMIELRVSVPEGGESYRIEVDRGAAWLAPSYVDATGQSHRYELPELGTPPLIDLNQAPEPALALIPIPEEDEVPQLALVPPSDQPPDLVPTEESPQLVLPRDDKSADAPPLVGLNESDKDDQATGEGFALNFSDKPKPSESKTNQPKSTSRLPSNTTREPPPARPPGPTLTARLAKTLNGFLRRGLGYSLGGDAEIGVDRLGARATAELILPMLEERFSALAYIGYRPSSLRGVAVTGQGVAMPLLVEAQQNDLPVGVALRWRSQRIRPLGLPVRIHVQGALHWVRRQQGLVLDTLRASRREVVSNTSQTRAGLGLGLSSQIGKIILEGTAGFDLGPATPISLGTVAQADYPGLKGLVKLGARWRFGDAELPKHLKALDRPLAP